MTHSFNSLGLRPLPLGKRENLTATLYKILEFAGAVPLLLPRGGVRGGVYGVL